MYRRGPSPELTRPSLPTGGARRGIRRPRRILDRLRSRSAVSHQHLALRAHGSDHAEALPDRQLGGDDPDRPDAHHRQAVDDVEAADLDGERLLVPASAYSEGLVSFARARRNSDAREAIAAMGIAVTPMTSSTAERAASLRATHDRLRLPEAIVLATAREIEARLLTYDDDLAKIATGD